MYVLSAKYAYDSCPCITIEYTKFLTGSGYVKITDFIYSIPLGNWTELKFSKNNRVDYIDFLKTMVFRNLDTQRRLARLALTRFDYAPSYFKLKALNAISILDKTFYGPVINLKCQWQRELLDFMTDQTSIHVISTCRNMDRLERYFNALQAQADQIE